jgi:dienelactone hydrolase
MFESALGPMGLKAISAQFCLAAVCLAHAASFAQGTAAGPSGDGAGDNLPPMAFEAVAFDSLDTAGFFTSRQVPIKGYLLVSRTGGQAPGAVLNPACEGLMRPDGGAQIRPKYQRMARRLHRLGITVLLVDGFSPRGFSETCAKPNVGSISRLMDALGGLVYLRSRNDVDDARVLLVAWGANDGIEGMSEGSSTLTKVGAGFAGAILYYPECSKAGRTFAPYAPIQVFVGGRDAWNPAAACEAAAQRQKVGSASFRIKVYPEAYHSFDMPFGERRMNDYNPKLGMVGRNASATLDSYQMVEEFASTVLGLQNKKVTK